MATWVVGDVHGCYDEFQKLLKNRNIKKDDTIILVGDIIDRGPQQIEMLKWAMENITENGKYQMVLGNHEDMVINKYHTCLNLLKCGEIENDIAYLACKYRFEYELQDAGYKTFEEIKPIIDWFENLPLYKEVMVNNKRHIIAHAWAWPNLRNTSRKTYLWFREVGDDFFDTITYDDENSVLIHGHTPTIFLPDYGISEEVAGKVFINKNGINIDCGLVYRTLNSNLAAIRLEDKKIIYLR